MQNRSRERALFVATWCALLAVKLVIAARLPLFVDEAFYWQEGRHLAAAYSDLPALTAWMTRLGVELGGQHPLALRMPFLLLASAIPWMIAGIGKRLFGENIGWQAGLLTMLMPLAGTLGVLAVPDVPLTFATVLCLDAGTRLLRAPDATGFALLAIGLMLGALSHYRFVAFIAVAGLTFAWLPQGRRLLGDGRLWLALLMGALAWWPLLAWNLANADAGLRFQLVDRHPWAFNTDGSQFLLVQTILVTPLLLFLLGVAVWAHRRNHDPAIRALSMIGVFTVIGFFVLGFFADQERVSFHWPLGGYLSLIPLLAPLLGAIHRWLRAATLVTAALGMLSVLGYYAALGHAPLRAWAASSRYYPRNFSGWDEVASAVGITQSGMPTGTRIVADNFKLGAELGFVLNQPDIEVLDHPINRHHGRAPQLKLWNLQRKDASAAPILLVVAPNELHLEDVPAHYHALCRQFGSLPPARSVQVDHGRQRFLLFELDRKPHSGPCITPAMAWVDAPLAGARVAATSPLEVAGWAFKDGSGIARVEVLLDGQPRGDVQYGLPAVGPKLKWPISTDPQHPDVGFRGRIDLSNVPRGRHWLGLRLHGRDGSIEDWSEQLLIVE